MGRLQYAVGETSSQQQQKYITPLSQSVAVFVVQKWESAISNFFPDSTVFGAVLESWRAGADAVTAPTVSCSRSRDLFGSVRFVFF